LPALRWASSLPPRSGWSELTRLDLPQVVRRVEEGVEEFRRRAVSVADGKSLRAGRAALEGLAAEIWGRELAAGLPLRLAHAASSYGFLPAADALAQHRDATESSERRSPELRGEVVLRAAGAWRRLDTPIGTVLARDGLALFAL
jgi:hypothetical protein